MRGTDFLAGGWEKQKQILRCARPRRPCPVCAVPESRSVRDDTRRQGTGNRDQGAGAQGGDGKLCGGGAECVDGGGEVGGEGLPGVRGELGAALGEVEDVDGGFAFGVDERDLDVALVGVEGEGDLAEQAGYVLRDDLEKGGVGGGFGVEGEARGDLDLDVGGVVEVFAGFEQLLDGDALGDDVVEVGEEAVFLAGVELDGAEDVSELEAVDDDAGIVGEGAGFDDVHAPGGEGSGDVGEEAAAVADDDGEVEELAVGTQVELDGIFVEVVGEEEVVADVLGEAGLEVALREAFKELFERGVLGRGDHGADAVEEGGVDGGVVADLIDGAVHEVGGGHVELPEIFGLPGSERLGIDGLDVGVGHEGEHLEQAGAADFVGEGADVFVIEDVAAHGIGHFKMLADEAEYSFALFGIEVEAGEEAVGEFDALGGVFAGAAAFAGVVEQEGE